MVRANPSQITTENMASTIQGLRDRLLTDPGFVIQYIYGNNPDQVILNLRALGFQISNSDDVFNAVNQLIEEGHSNVVNEAFNVPFLTDQVDPAEIAVVREVVAAFQNIRQ